MVPRDAILVVRLERLDAGALRPVEPLATLVARTRCSEYVDVLWTVQLLDELD